MVGSGSNIVLKRHAGVVLEPSRDQFDQCGSAFGCILPDKNGDSYFYYAGSMSLGWKKASIGVATSKNGIEFTKLENPIVAVGRQSVTPVVFSLQGKYWMVFATSDALVTRRNIAVATADDPLGPWNYIGRLMEPNESWEAGNVDLGPSVVRRSNEEVLIYYSNVSSGPISRLMYGSRRLRRQLGILRLRLTHSGNVICDRMTGNPLKHLNGEFGTWNESLFCSGYFELNGRHYLFPACSTYSMGKPYRQYIGLVESTSPLFKEWSYFHTLISGPSESDIIPNPKGAIALDSPCPLKKADELWLYYAVMDRADGIWKTALSIFNLDD